jgi:hypothetical protein
MKSNQYYSAPGPMGVKAFKFIAQLLSDPTLNLNEPIVDNYLFEVGSELGWKKYETVHVIKFMKFNGMLV